MGNSLGCAYLGLYKQRSQDLSDSSTGSATFDILFCNGVGNMKKGFSYVPVMDMLGVITISFEYTLYGKKKRRMEMQV